MITTNTELLSAHYDVAVIGSGAAGLVAAVRAADAGHSVVVLEKAATLGGTSGLSGGVMWAPNNHLMREAGFEDSDEQGRDYLTAAAGDRMSEAEIDWYIQTSQRAVRFLDAETHVSLVPLGRPDYHLEWPGATTGGRGLDNNTFDPADYDPAIGAHLRKPTYFPLISMSERDGLNGSAPDAKLLASRKAQGVRTMGGALVGNLLASALERGIHVVRDARVTNLSRSANSGWSLTIRDGAFSLGANNVVIASGGFEWNPALVSALLPFTITPISAPSNEGDGLSLGLGVGGSLDELTHIWGVPVITPPTDTYDGKQSGRMGNVEMTLPGSITVNAAGKRFVNEALNYHDLTRVFGNVDPTTSQPANSPAWLVFDHRFLSRYPVAGSTPGTPTSWMTSAASPAELATKLGIPAASLEATIARFNVDAKAGVDTEFGRGSSPQDIHLGDATNLPNPCLAPLATGPFYAVPVHPGALGTAGGLRVNLNGQALDFNDTPIEGLYAAGNCSATAFRDAYPGGGATLGSAITRGFAVGEHLAAQRS